jgi:hypothetical protein
MDAGDVFLIIFLLFVALTLTACWWHRRKIQLQQQQFIAWAGEQMHQAAGTRSRGNSRSGASSIGISDEESLGRRRLNSSESDASDFSFISVNFDTERDDVPDVALSTWAHKDFGISCDYPKAWRVHKKTPGTIEQTSQLLVEMVVRRSEEVYMRLSIAFDDVCWSKLTPRTFSRHMVSDLPTAVPGSRTVRQGPVADSKCGAFEILYTIPDEDNNNLYILSYFYVGNTRAFTVSFTIEQHNFHQYERFIRTLLNSFAIQPLTELRVANVQETFYDPLRTNWSHYQSMPEQQQHKGATSSSIDSLVPSKLIHPVHWTKEYVENPRVVRFCCGRGEQCLKMINYFIVDMTALGLTCSDDELLSDLAVFYKQEMGSQGVHVVKEMSVQIGERKAGMNGPFCAFQTRTKKNKFVNVKSHVLVGLHRNRKKVFGHIVTVTLSSDYFEKYQKFAQYVFRKFIEENHLDKDVIMHKKKSGHVVEPTGEKKGRRQRSPSGRFYDGMKL